MLSFHTAHTGFFLTLREGSLLMPDGRDESFQASGWVKHTTPIHTLKKCTTPHFRVGEIIWPSMYILSCPTYLQFIHDIMADGHENWVKKRKKCCRVKQVRKLLHFCEKNWDHMNNSFLETQKPHDPPICMLKKLMTPHLPKQKHNPSPFFTHPLPLVWIMNLPLFLTFMMHHKAWACFTFYILIFLNLCLFLSVKDRCSLNFWVLVFLSDVHWLGKHALWIIL